MCCDSSGPHGDVGILTATNRQADDVMTVLRTAGVPFVSLKDYRGKQPVDAVKVGPAKRAKGLEFEQVLLAHVWAGCSQMRPRR